MTALTELEKTLLDACRIALRQLYASNENDTLLRGAGLEGPDRGD